MNVDKHERYGSIELKRSYNRNLAQGFLLSVVLHVGLIGACLMTIGSSMERVRVRPVLPKRDTIVIVPPSPGTHIVSRGEQSGGGSSDEIPDGGAKISVPKPATLIGNLPMPVLDDLVDDSLDLEGIASALVSRSPSGEGDPFGGDGTGTRGRSWGDTSGHGPSARSEAISSEPTFIPHEVDPGFDQSELRRRVRYPDIARRNGLEGQVVLNVFVGANGAPLKTVVEYSSNKVFESAAIGAVMETRFTPAEQNGEPVGVWMSLPIDFSLR